MTMAKNQNNRGCTASILPPAVQPRECAADEPNPTVVVIDDPHGPGEEKALALLGENGLPAGVELITISIPVRTINWSGDGYMSRREFRFDGVMRGDDADAMNRALDAQANIMATMTDLPAHRRTVSRGDVIRIIASKIAEALEKRSA